MTETTPPLQPAAAPNPHTTPPRHRTSPEEALSPPSHNTPLASSQESHSWDDLHVYRGSFSSEHQVLTSINNEAFEERMRRMERMDLQTLLKNIHRLERLLSLNRSERKLEASRHEQDIKELARELSIKEAEAIQLGEDLQATQQRAGELMDECEAALRERDQAQRALENERSANEHLQISYDALAARVGMLCEESQRTAALREELAATIKGRSEADQQLGSLRMEREQMERRLWEWEQRCQELEGRMEQLREEARSKDEMVSLCKEYEQKLTELEEKIDNIEEEGEFVHRIAYSAHQPIRIEDDAQQLRRIVEEELEESLPSLDDHLRTDDPREHRYDKSHQELVTATTLVDHRELELLQLLTQNLQREHSQLKQLYGQQQDVLAQKHAQMHDLEKSLAQMRVEFMVELSRVTALMNQQILHNRQLRDHNNTLQAHLDRLQLHPLQPPLQPHQPKTALSQPLQVLPPQRTIESSYLGVNFERESCQRRRCRQLEEDNQMLLRYNMERQQLYGMIIGKEGSDLVVERFENSFKYILQHREQYGSLLRAYGFNPTNAQQEPENITDLINNFTNSHKKDSESEIRKFQVFQSQNDNELLIQSTAKLHPENTLNSLQTVVTTITDLYRERQRAAALAFKKRPQQSCSEKAREGIAGQIQRLKVMVVREAKGQSKEAVRLLRQLEQAIDQYCFT